MSDIESEYSDYQSARDLEGGEQRGRGSPYRGWLFTAVCAVALLVAGLVLLALLGN